MPRSDVEAREAIAGYVVGEELLRHAFEDASIASYILGADGRILRVNWALCRLLGYQADELIGMSIKEVAHADDARAMIPATAILRPGEVERSRSDRRLVRKDGRSVDVELSWFAIGGLDGSAVYSIAHVQDVSHRKAVEARIAHLAMHDPLTDLPNRALFVDRLEQGIRRLARADGLLAVLFVDLDRF